MERIVFLERSSVGAEVRRPAFAHEWREYAESGQEQAVERLEGATVAIMNKIALGEAELSQLPALKLIAVAATGTDRIDLASCARRRISVTNVRGYAATSVSEHVLMLVLALRRNLAGYRGDVRRGLWQQSKQFCLLTHEIQDIRAGVLGVVGYGALGRATADLARAFGMRVLVGEHKGAAEVREGRVPFEELLRESDVVTLHAPLREETHRLIGARELELMKPTALLINTARGLLVDEEALADALRRGRIAGAGVDVLSNEPPREGNPLLEVSLPNLIVTPHVAWASRGAMQSLADQLIDNIEAFFRGEPMNLVTSKP
ncbi:MAG: D-2-hydroxyacid dehydrogenase [Acidobacteria bacterium]|nr:D-2-hydroxyacid dehydrogenase [Acidobacteriota bacterium]MCA1641137.1 D-2-hydroxyacid dehydrogenase [Acidobacteriota bacterium]